MFVTLDPAPPRAVPPHAPANGNDGLDPTDSGGRGPKGRRGPGQKDRGRRQPAARKSPAAEPAAPLASARAARRGRQHRGARVTPYLYVLPAVVLLVVWSYSPLAQTLYLSLFDWNLLPTSPKRFVGLENFAEALTLPQVGRALVNTLVYITALAGFSLALPLVIGLAAQQVRGRWKTFYQALIFVPFLLTPVATSAVWRWLWADEGGLITLVLRSLGLDVDHVFRDQSLAIVAIIAAVGWQLLGFGVLVIAAGLAGINPDYAAAASLDGAGWGRITWRLTLPLLSPTLVFLGLMTILLAAPWTFSLIDMITKGGPVDSTTNIYYILYQFGFQNFDSGLSAALGVLFFIAFGLVALGFVETTERLSFYDD
ncbi:MAG: sugar ABC transporter permease [Bifidobacteriaceae bacterium]|jgi:multiple sugar transport system permease protein|nr:sugar ABC transporter permease [Bifidobacteriaceae bacterium]